MIFSRLQSAAWITFVTSSLSGLSLITAQTLPTTSENATELWTAIRDSSDFYKPDPWCPRLSQCYDMLVCLKRMPGLCPDRIFYTRNCTDADSSRSTRDCFCEAMITQPCSGLCMDDLDNIWYLQWVLPLCGDTSVPPKKNHNKSGILNFTNHWPEFETHADKAYKYFIPWSWTLQPLLTSENGTSTLVNCPEPKTVLSVFSIESAVTAVVSFIASNRYVAGLLTRGRLGQPGTIRWPLAALLSVALTLFGNLINAIIITTKTPGYAHVPLGELFMLYNARPRFGWMLIFLAFSWKLNDPNMFIASAIVSSLAEALLQIIGSPYLFKVFRRAITLPPYLRPEWLQSLPHGQYARLMFIGGRMYGAVFIVLATIWFSLGLGFAIFMSDHVRDDRRRRGRYTQVVPAGKGVSMNDELKRMGISKFGWWALCAQTVVLSVVAAGQWLFWIGFVNTSADRFCPPNIWTSAGIWTAFSSLGVLSGSIFA